jgi:ribonucleoside-diphosphate reductase alpha chain
MFCCHTQIPRWDTSKLRAKGARLKTFGGRASGPEPLEALFLFAVNMFQHARGRRLTPLEAHDLVCKVAEIVVVGGVRRWAESTLWYLISRLQR